MAINIADFTDLNHLADNVVDNNKHYVGLADVDETQFDDDMGTNILVHVRDDGEDDMPSIKYGLPVMIALYAAIVILAIGLVAAIVYCSRNQEKSKSKKDEGTFWVLLLGCTGTPSKDPL